MYVEKASEKDDVLETVWLTREQREQLEQYVVAATLLRGSQADWLSRSSAPMNLPWSQGFYLSCQDVSAPLALNVRVAHLFISDTQLRAELLPVHRGRFATPSQH